MTVSRRIRFKKIQEHKLISFKNKFQKTSSWLKICGGGKRWVNVRGCE